jgi:RNA methyltransferase, TrmH family
MLHRSRVKDIQSLAHKKSREETGLYVVEGPKMVAELLHWKPGSLRSLYATASWIPAHESHLNAAARNVLTCVTDDELSSISFLQTPNQVLAVAEKPTMDEPLNLNGRITLLLDTIQDPGNMGTILRTADWFGIDQVICSPDSADIFNPKVVQATMGAVFRIRVHVLDPLSVVDQLGTVPLICSALEGDNLFTSAPLKEAVIVIGNESRGASPALMSRASRRITIPRYGHAESLNAAVATGIILSRLCCEM